MSECVNIEMRELLPDLLHGELSAGRRAQVESHVASCPSCADELALLREARAAMRAMYEPRIDTAAIVAALPKPAPRVTSAGTRGVATRPRLQWRIAAAIAAVAIGGLSYVVGRSSPPAAIASIDTAAAVADTSTVGGGGVVESTLAMVDTPVSGSGSPRAATAHSLLAAGGVGDLDDSALEALLGDLERIEAAPVAEPETLSGTRLVNGGTTGTEE